MIPILLTTGVCCLAIAACKWLSPADTPLGQQSPAMAFGLIAMGVLSLAGGLMMMLIVKYATK